MLAERAFYCFSIFPPQSFLNAGDDIFKVPFRNDIISVFIQMVADIAILFDILNPADMGWITKCHHRMQLLILRQSKQR